MKSESGFTVLEMTLAATLIMVTAAAAIPMIDSAVQQSRVEAAQQFVIMQMRLARQWALDQRRVHTISFTGSRDITIACQGTGCGPDVRLSLPTDMSFDRSGVSDTPDQLTMTGAVSFNGNNWVRFSPDGSAVDGAGQICNGAVVISRPGDSSTVRAVTLFGATGRIKGYRWVCNGETGGWH